jgi:hypothetical protein
MRGILADVRFPMPAALAFLAVGNCNINRKTMSSKIEDNL